MWMEMADSSRLIMKSRESPPGEAKVLGSALEIRGHELWLRLKKGFRRAVEKIKNEEMKMAYLSHGLQHLHRIAFLHPVRHVTHDSLKKVFVVLDAENGLHLYKEDGFFLGSRRAPVPMKGLLYASQVDHFVAWEKDALRVLNSSLEVLSEVHSALPIRCSLYSELLNRIVTAGNGNLTVWRFRCGSKNLQCLTTVSDRLGPNTVFSRLALDTSGTEPQRCFASCETGVAAFDISHGALISFKTKLHSRVITDIAYCVAAGSLVTASRDTTIKVWDETWHIRTVFVGHTAPVIAVTAYPQRPLIFSASQDGTIRTWNLDTVDQVDQVHVSEPVEALKTQTTSHVISVSGASLTLWKINKLYSLYAPLGSPVKRLRCIDMTAVANFPVRVVCACQDSTVRVLDAPTGEVLSVLFLKLQVLDVAYCLPRETLFVLMESGSLLRVNAATDPMIVRKSMPRPSPESQPSCLLLYSHIADPEKAFRTWLEVVAQKSHRKSWQKIPLQMQEKNRYVLIMGQEDGLLSVVEWFSGRIECQVEAHTSQRVTALAEYPSQTCIISAGADRTVKMWRVFPYAEESLVLLLCFSCAVPAWHLCCLQDTLAVAFQDPETVTYRIVYYNLMEQSRQEHRPEDDPMDDITGLCCCPHLKLFASASRDGSVKVWNSQNQLLRHLKLNTIPESLAFANPEGDLLVGIERHLYRIHHKKYLPSYYNMTLLCARFLEPIQNTTLPITRASLEILIRDNVVRLKQERPSEDSGSPLPGAPPIPVQESRVRKSSQLEEAKVPPVPPVPEPKSHDLQQLQLGNVRAVKKVRFTKSMREEAFEQYLRVFYRERPKVKIPEEDAFNADEVLEALSRGGSVSSLYGPDPNNMFLGSFPELASLKATRELLKDAGSLAGRDSLASSTLAVRHPPASSSQLRGGEKKTAAEGEAPPEGKKPRRQLLRPNLDVHPYEALKAPGTLRAPPLEGRFLETIFGKVRLPRELRTDLSPIREDEQRTLKVPSWLSSLGSSALLAVVDADRSQKSLSSEEASMAMESRESYKRSKSSLHSRSKTFSKISKESFLHLGASRDGIETLMGSESLLLPPKVSSGFIPNSVFAQQWQGQEYSPGLETRSPEEPRSPALSLSSVRAAIQDPEPAGREPRREKAGKRSQSIPEEEESSSRVFLTQLDESHYPEREAKSSTEEVSAFYSRFKDAGWFQELFPEDFPPGGTDMMELLGHLLSAMPAADFSTKAQLLDAILSLREALGPGMSGMVHTTLIGLLNLKKGAPSVKEETQRRFILAALRALLTLNKDSRDLMVELMTYYLQAPPAPRLTIEGLIGEMGVQDPHRFFFEEMDSWQVKKGGSKKELRKACSLWLERAMQEFQEHHDLLALKEKTQRKHSCSLSPPLKVTRPPRWKDTRSVHPVDAINYFVEQQLEKQLVGKIQQSVAQPEELPRDTVMALPPIRKSQAILRLGETNAMLRTRIPEHFYFPYIFPRYLLKGFVPFVKLALPKINVIPFPSASETPVSPETFTARQQLVQKYFIPKFSYADSYP